MTKSTNQVSTEQRAKAELFRSLHERDVLVLPNAWDAASAALIAAAGAAAVATTSGGVSWALGRSDGQALTRAEMISHIERITAVVQIPVSADIEGGYGPAPDDVATTVEAAIAAGAVGVNLEDSQAPGGPLFSNAEQSARLDAARAAADRAGLPELVINARTDVFLFNIGHPDDRLADVASRADAYAKAGADSLFAPGLLNLDTLAELAQATSLPINAMVGPGAPTVAQLRAAGVRRISLGTALAQSAYAVAHQATSELITHGTYHALADPLDFSTINDLLKS